jgi:CRP/FNR family transcriptional regulator
MNGETDNVVRVQYAQRHCNRSDLHPVCPAKLATQKDEAAAALRHTHMLERGEYLFRQGDNLQALSVIHCGSLKGYFSTPNGLTYVTKFYLPGDVVGLDALGDERHNSSAQALETTSYCRLDLHLSANDGYHSQTLNGYLLKLAGREMVNENRRAVILAQRDAEVRLGLFLLQLSQHHAKRGFSEREFNLSMSRRDIGSYLALTMETVSRMFTHFQSVGLIKVDRRSVRLISLGRLRKVASAEHLFHEH